MKIRNNRFVPGTMLILLFFLNYGVLSAQPYKPLITFNGDTSAYLLYNLVKRSSTFHDKPFNAMLEQLEIPVIAATPLIDAGGETEGRCYGIELMFYSRKIIDQKIAAKKEPALIQVYWKSLVFAAPSEYFGRLNWPVKSILNYYTGNKVMIDSVKYVSYYNKHNNTY